MKKESKITVWQQINNNVVAIVSLIVAITALVYNTWREEQTEKNRTLRASAFEVLMNLGELQQVVNYNYYKTEDPMRNLMTGWGHTALIGDLSQLLPPPVPKTADSLITTWKAEWKQIDTNEESADKVSAEIDKTRQAVMNVLIHLK